MRNCYRLLLLTCFVPSVTLALGLGDIHLKSALNAPLDADIDVVGATPDELSGLRATLASRETFKRYGLDYPQFLAGVTVAPQQTADGHTTLHLHSADVVNEPFVTLLVEAIWARGDLVHEYTVLLDPPVFANAAPSATTVAAPLTGEAARSGGVERRAASTAAPANSTPNTNPSPPLVAAEPMPQSAPASPSSSAPAAAPARAAAAAGVASAAAAGGTYNVRNGDTLTSITNQFYGPGDHLARQRELVGVYRANTAAFDGNMNLLRAGSRLTLPSESDLAAISPGEAAGEVRRQYGEWNASHGNAAGTSGAAAGAAGAGQLRLVPPQEPAQAPAGRTAGANPPAAPANETGAAAAAATAALQQRVSQLESQLAESQRLLNLKNSQLAALQQAHAAPAASAPPAPVSPAPATVPAPPPPATAVAPSVEPSAPPPAVVTKPAAPRVAATQPSNSYLDLLEEYWYVPAGLIAVLIALLVLRAVRARQEDAFDRTLGRLSEPGLDAQGFASERTSDTVPVRALAPTREEQSYRVEESGAHEQPPALVNKAAAPAQAAAHVAIEESVPSEAPVALDQGDPLAEADFHMAYGLYDQAADLVQIAISREPARRDLQLKLLEVFFVWGNKDRFLSSARELAATRDKALPGEWEKIVIMGRQIAPEDPLFANAGALPGAASGGVDLNLEGGQNRIDFDLMGEPTVSEPRTSGGVDLDLGAALGHADPEATGESATASESGIDFVFDDVERGNEATGSTREMPNSSSSSATATVQVAGSPGMDPDAPTVEQPMLPAPDHPTIRQKLDAAARAGVVSSEQTAELELHDLGLDLGPLDGTGDEVELPGSADAPTMLAGMDDETRQLLAHADKQRGSTADETAIRSAPTDSGTWLFTDADFGDVLPPDPDAARKDRSDAPTELVTQLTPRPSPAPGEGDINSTAQLATLDTEALDLDLSEQRKKEIARDANGVDLDVGPALQEGTFVQTQRIMAEDVALPDLEPATMSEVGTKLDLARAYMDMGDPEGARSILSEVLLEGSVSQKQEARRLIDTLPG